MSDIDRFVGELVKLCKKHNMMIGAQFHPMCIYPYPGHTYQAPRDTPMITADAITPDGVEGKSEVANE